MFNKQQTLRVINRNHSLSKKYLELVKKDGIEVALTYAYDWIQNDIGLKQEYEILTPEIDRPTIVAKDTIEVAYIRSLVNEWGWQQFIEAVTQYTNSKAGQMSILGLYDRQKEWNGIRDRLNSVRRRVQL